MLGNPKVLVCDAQALGPHPSLTIDASEHSQRGFSVYVCSCVLVCLCVTLCFCRARTPAILNQCVQCIVFYVYILVYAHKYVSLWWRV